MKKVLMLVRNKYLRMINIVGIKERNIKIYGCKNRIKRAKSDVNEIKVRIVDIELGLEYVELIVGITERNVGSKWI